MENHREETRRGEGGVMRRHVFLIPVAIAAIAEVMSAQTQPLRIDRIDGGPAATSLGQNTLANKASSLRREWITVNSDQSPVQIGLGVQAVDLEDRYSFHLVGVLTPSIPIVAVETISVLFDIWGNRMENLRHLEIADRAEFKTVPVQESSWLASENETYEYLTCVTYVRYVRTKNGKIWIADLAAISKKLSEVQFNISEQGLEYLSPDDKRK